MPDLYMDVDAALAEVPVNILPLIDDTDFKTREVAIAYNQAGMDLVWNFCTTAGAMTQVAVTPTTAGLHDWAHQGDGMYSIEIPASGGTINNDTEGFGWFTGFCTGVLPWRGPTIGFRAAGLNDLLIDSAYSATRGLAGTALPAAAADAAGGLPISDAGGLDLDTQVGTDIDAILVDTAVIGALGAGLTAVPWNSAWDAEVQSEAADALTAYDPPTKAEMDTAHALLATPANVATELGTYDAPTKAEMDTAHALLATPAQVNTEVDTALADIDLDHLIQVTAGAEEPTDGSYLDQIMHKAAGQTFDATTDSLEAIRDTAPLGTAMRGTDSAALATVCTEVRLAELAAANIPSDLDAVKAQTDKILILDTGAPNTWAHGSLADRVASKDANRSFDSNTDSLEALRDRLDNVESYVDELETRLTAVRAGYLDELAAANIPADLDAVLADTAELQGLIAAGKLPAQVKGTDDIDLSATQKASVNAEVVDAMNGDTYAEPGQGAPAATATLAAKIGYLYKAFRNKITQTATELDIYDDAGSTVDQKATVSDDGTTFTRGEIGSGP